MNDEPDHMVDDDIDDGIEGAKAQVRSLGKRGRPPKVRTEDGGLYRIRLLRNYWPHDGSGKAQTGEVVSVGRDEARALLACGIGERENPLEL